MKGARKLCTWAIVYAIQALFLWLFINTHFYVDVCLATRFFCVWWMMNALDVNAFLYIKIKAVIKRMFISLSRSFTRSFSTLRRVLLNVLIMKNNYKPSRVSFQLCVLIIAGSQIILSVESKTSVVFFIIKKG